MSMLGFSRTGSHLISDCPDTTMTVELMVRCFGCGTTLTARDYTVGAVRNHFRKRAAESKWGTIVEGPDTRPRAHCGTCLERILRKEGVDIRERTPVRIMAGEDQGRRGVVMWIGTKPNKDGNRFEVEFPDNGDLVGYPDATNLEPCE